MGVIRVELELPEDLWHQLSRVSETLGCGPTEQAAIVAIGDWVAQRLEELDARDPQVKYFINAALDELIEKKRS